MLVKLGKQDPESSSVFTEGHTSTSSQSKEPLDSGAQFRNVSIVPKKKKVTCNGKGDWAPMMSISLTPGERSKDVKRIATAFSSCQSTSSEPTVFVPCAHALASTPIGCITMIYFCT